MIVARRRPLLQRRRCGKLYVLAFCDSPSQRADGPEQRRSVVALPHQRTHIAQGSTGKTVCNIRLKAPAHLNPVFVIFDDQQQQQPFVLLIADAPFPPEFERKVLHRLVAQSVDRHNGELRAQLLIHLRAKAFQSLFIGKVEHIRQIADIPGRLGDGGKIDRANRSCRREYKEEEQAQATAKTVRHAGMSLSVWRLGLCRVQPVQGSQAGKEPSPHTYDYDRSHAAQHHGGHRAEPMRG